MGARYIVEGAIGQILESSGDTGRRVIFHGRDVDDFRDFLRYDGCHVGTGFPLAEEIGVAVNLGFVAIPATGECVLDAHNANLWRQQRLITADIDLVGIPVVDQDVPSRHPNGADSRNNLANDLGRRTASGRSGWVDLDADNVFRFDEFGPRITCRGFTRQRLHALLELTLYDRLRNAVSYDRTGVAHLDDSSGKQSRHAKRRWLVVWQAVKFNRRSSGNRIRSNRLRMHLRIETLHEQRSASNTTDLDEGTTVHIPSGFHSAKSQD